MNQSKKSKLYQSYTDPLYQASKEALYFDGVLVYDGVCGIGKTTRVFELLNNHDKYFEQLPKRKRKQDKFIFVTPFLSECHRIAGTEAIMSKGIKPNWAPKRNSNGSIIYKGTETKRHFVHPINKGKGKLDNIKELISSDRDIVTTHASFSHFDRELIELLKTKQYHLIVDEAPACLEMFSDLEISGLNLSDIKGFLDRGVLTVDETTGLLSWKVSDENNREFTRYKDIKKLCDEQKLILFHNKNKPTVIWRQNPEVFACFQSVRVLTYLFDSSLCKAFFDIYGIRHIVRNMTKEEIFSSRMPNYINLISTTSGTSIPNMELPDHAFSSSWYSTQIKSYPDTLKQVKNATESFFKNITRTSTDQNIWTTFKKAKSYIKGKGYTKGFLECNARATNIYADRQAIAYLVNIYLNPIMLQFIRSKGVEFNQDQFSLSEMIQFIFRSRVRTGQPITVFIPSRRMSKILIDWIKDFSDYYESQIAQFNLASENGTPLSSLIDNSSPLVENQEDLAADNGTDLSSLLKKPTSNMEESDIDKRAERGTDLNSLLGE